MLMQHTDQGGSKVSSLARESNRRVVMQAKSRAKCLSQERVVRNRTHDFDLSAISSLHFARHQGLAPNRSSSTPARCRQWRPVMHLARIHHDDIPS